VYEQYREIARREEKRVVVIADEAPIDAIAGRILEVVHARMAETGVDRSAAL
jgi:thymidylate kinase